MKSHLNGRLKFVELQNLLVAFVVAAEHEFLFGAQNKLACQIDKEDAFIYRELRAQGSQQKQILCPEQQTTKKW